MFGVIFMEGRNYEFLDKREIELELAKECLIKGIILYSGVKGYSMFPWINPSDKILIKKVPVERIKIGDIIVIHSEEAKVFVAHRVIRIQREIDGKSFLTKGDFLFFTDELIKEKEVIGKVIEIIKKGRRLKITLENKEREIFSYLIAKYSYGILILYDFLRKKMGIRGSIIKLYEIISVIPYIVAFVFYIVYNKFRKRCERFILLFFQRKRRFCNAKSNHIE